MKFQNLFYKNHISINRLKKLVLSISIKVTSLKLRFICLNKVLITKFSCFYTLRIVCMIQQQYNIYKELDI